MNIVFLLGSNLRIQPVPEVLKQEGPKSIKCMLFWLWSARDCFHDSISQFVVRF
jgi:hypothetical protein